MRTVEGYLGLWKLTYPAPTQTSTSDPHPEDHTVLVRVRRAISGEVKTAPLSLIVEEIEGKLREGRPEMVRIMPKKDLVFSVSSIRLGRYQRGTGLRQAIVRGRPTEQYITYTIKTSDVISHASMALKGEGPWT